MNDLTENKQINGGDKILMLPTVWLGLRFPEVFLKHGESLKLTSKGDAISVLAINEDFFAATLGHLGNPKSPTVYVTREDRFYTYDSAVGIYVSKSENQIINELSGLLQQCADECNKRGICDTSSLKFNCNKSGQLTGVIRKAKGQLHVTEDYFISNLEKYIACDNGMLCLADNVLVPFSADFRRRNKLSVKYDPSATCPLFLDTLNRPRQGTPEARPSNSNALAGIVARRTGKQSKVS